MVWSFFPSFKLTNPILFNIFYLKTFHSSISRNTSASRKCEIIADLQLPLSHPNKLLKAVVATISLGVGVDLRVKNVVSFGLGATPEDTVQEAGRCMRGSSEETRGQRGLAFFFQKGSVAAMHCVPASDCRSLISDPLPQCQTNKLYSFFDDKFEYEGSPCNCCYKCILKDATEGCRTCETFLQTYLKHRELTRLPRSTLSDLRSGIQELFRGLGLRFIQIESELHLSTENFLKDFLKTFDEVSCFEDIVKLWHVSESLAEDLYGVCLDVIENCREENEIEICEDKSESESSASFDSSGASLSDIDYESVSETESTM